MKLRPIDNPPNPYHSQHAHWLEPPPEAKLEIYEERSGSILSENKSPDIPYRWSVNPYRGCQHACSYCYARAFHEYLGYGAGTDFETKLVVKRDAPELLAKAFRKRGWKQESVNFSGVTDCYQPIEASYGLTRACLKVCLDFRNPAAVVTKSFLVVRDIDLLVELNSTAGLSVCISIPFADAAVCRIIEPQAPPPARRFEAIRRLSEAGLPVTVFVSPIIPGLNDRDIPAILSKAADAGARSATFTALHLQGSVEQIFVERLQQEMPLQAKRILNRVREIRGGSLSESRFGKRMRGEGPYWKTITGLFEMHRRRLGLAKPAGLRTAAKLACEKVDSSKVGNSSPQQLTLPFS